MTEWADALPTATDRFLSYLGGDILAVTRFIATTMKDEPIPYRNWEWCSLPAPAHRQDGLDWTLQHDRLRRWMDAGGILVIVGPPRSGKTTLVERLLLAVVNNSRPPLWRNAPVASEDLPASGLFAIDDTDYHNRIDVSRILHGPMMENRGFALVFQTPEIFRNYEIWPLFADRKLLILELSKEGVTGHSRLTNTISGIDPSRPLP